MSKQRDYQVKQGQDVIESLYYSKEHYYLSLLNKLHFAEFAAGIASTLLIYLVTLQISSSYKTDFTNGKVVILFLLACYASLFIIYLRAKIPSNKLKIMLASIKTDMQYDINLLKDFNSDCLSVVLRINNLRTLETEDGLKAEIQEALDIPEVAQLKCISELKQYAQS